MRKLLFTAVPVLIMISCNPETSPKSASENSIKTESSPKTETQEDVQHFNKEKAEKYVEQMNNIGVPCKIDEKEKSINIEIDQMISNNYDILANSILNEARAEGVDINTCKVYYKNKVVGNASTK